MRLGIFVFILFAAPRLAWAGFLESKLPGLVAAWYMNEGNGTITSDFAGDNDCTLTNSPVWVTAAWGFGVQTGATNKHLSCANEAKFDFDKTDPFSIILAFRVDATPSSGDVLAGKTTWDDSGYTIRYLVVNTTFTFNFVVKSNPGTFQVRREAFDLDDWRNGEFHVLIVTYDGLNAGVESVKIYADGVDGPLTSTSDATISGNGMLNNEAFMMGGVNVSTVESDITVSQGYVFNRAISKGEAWHYSSIILGRY